METVTVTQIDPNDPTRMPPAAPGYTETVETVVVRDSSTGWWIAGILGGGGRCCGHGRYLLRCELADLIFQSTNVTFEVAKSLRNLVDFSKRVSRLLRRRFRGGL